MPNQYTKFQEAAAQDPTSKAFTWREWKGKKQQRGRNMKKSQKTSAVHGPKRRASNSDESTTNGSTTNKNTRTSQPLNSPLLPPSPLLVYLPSGGFRIDPFRSYPVAPNHEEMAVLDHCTCPTSRKMNHYSRSLDLYILAPSGKMNDLVARPRNQFVDPHINLLLPYVMHDSCLFDAMLAGCQASISMSSGLSAYSDQFFIVHRGRAMAALRQKLANNPDASTFVIITLLLTCDYLLGDLKAVEGHTRALQTMTQLHGQLPSRSRWDRFVKQGVEAYTYVGLMATGSPEQGRDNPLDQLVDPFKDLEYPEQPFSSEMCEQWTNLPPGFLDLMFASQLSTQLCAIITAFDQVAAQSNPTSVTNLRVLHPIQAALQRFGQHKQATYLERCVAAGLITYSFQYPRIQIPNMFHDPPLQGMLRLFSVNYRTSSKIERDVLIWAVVVAQGFMFTRATPLPKSKDIFLQFIARHPVMRTWSSIEKILRRYLWTPALLERWRIFHEAMLKDSVDNDIQTVNSSPSEDFSDILNNTVASSPIMCPVTGHLTDTIGADSGMCPFFQKAGN